MVCLRSKRALGHNFLTRLVFLNIHVNIKRNRRDIDYMLLGAEGNEMVVTPNVRVSHHIQHSQNVSLKWG